MKVADVPDTAADEAIERIEDAAAKRQEQFVAKHILGGATDGCMCEPCISARQLVERVKAAVESSTIMRFRKMLDRIGIHGYYSEMQKEFGDGPEQSTAAAEETI